MLTFNRPSLVGNELRYIEDAVRSGVISGEGTYGVKCQALLQSILETDAAVLLTPSCTDALEMCALLLELGEQDEVVVPSFTFVSTATAFALRGTRVRFADVQPETLNLDPASVESVLTEKTKAIAAVHYGGVACEMDRLQQIAESRKISLIEDAAHALGACFRGRALGTFGTFSTFSFHETKNATCGEGGALVINDPAFVERAHIIQDKGTNRKKFQRGDAAFYSWVGLGSSYVMSDVLAAFLCAQLEQIEKINNKRRAIYAAYRDGLQPLKDRGVLQFPAGIDLESSSAHLFFILLRDYDERERLRNFLVDRGIFAVFHYQPLHQSPYVVSRWGPQPALPVTESVCPRLLRLPMFFDLTLDDVAMVVAAVTRFFS